MVEDLREAQETEHFLWDKNMMICLKLNVEENSTEKATK